MKTIFLMCFLFFWSVQGFAVGTWKKESISSIEGVKTYFTYTPSAYTGAPLPLLVMIHGCHQDATTFAQNTGMNQIAEKYGFLVLYPQQDELSNLENCWNFFFGVNQTRNGEPAIIVDMVNRFRRSVAVDEGKIFSAGLSSGAAMSAILSSCYTDIFSGAAIASGLEYEAAEDVPGAYAAMDNGASQSPKQSARDALACVGKGHARMQKIFAIQGTADKTVNPINLEQIVTQFNTMNDLLSAGTKQSNLLNTIQGQVPGGRAYTIDYYGATASNPMLAKVKVIGMDHAWSGGPLNAQWYDPSGPNASEMLWLFFGGK